MTDREIMQQALDALVNGKRVRFGEGGTKYQPDLEDAAIEALEAALAQPEQEPVAKHICNLWINPETSFYEVDRCTHPINEVFPVYTAPPRKEWVGLTDDEIKKIMQQWRNGYIDIKDVEQLLKEKNNAV